SAARPPATARPDGSVAVHEDRSIRTCLRRQKARAPGRAATGAAGPRATVTASRQVGLVELALDDLLGVAEALLDDPVELVGRALGLEEVVVGELAPDALGLALELVPLALRLVLIVQHGVSPS